MKLDFFNDTGRPLQLHLGTEGTKRRTIKAAELVTFDLPDGCRPFVKLWWDGTLMVRGNPENPPTIDELIGLVPGITGGKTTEEYIRWLRDEEEKE